MGGTVQWSVYIPAPFPSSSHALRLQAYFKKKFNKADEACINSKMSLRPDSMAYLNLYPRDLAQNVTE